MKEDEEFFFQFTVPEVEQRVALMPHSSKVRGLILSLGYYLCTVGLSGVHPGSPIP